MIRGFAVAAVLFVTSFALHIVGGATDQAWLFIIAVALIFLSATGFAAIMHAAAGKKARASHGRAMWIVGGVTGIALTTSALWAVNERAFAPWQAPVATVAVGLVSSALWILLRQRIRPAIPAAKSAGVKAGRRADARVR